MPPATYTTLLKKAQELGIVDPAALSIDELRHAIMLVERRLSGTGSESRIHAQRLGIKLQPVASEHQAKQQVLAYCADFLLAHGVRKDVQITHLGDLYLILSDPSPGAEMLNAQLVSTGANKRIHTYSLALEMKEGSRS